MSCMVGRNDAETAQRPGTTDDPGALLVPCQPPAGHTGHEHWKRAPPPHSASRNAHRRTLSRAWRPPPSRDHARVDQVVRMPTTLHDAAAYGSAHHHRARRPGRGELDEPQRVGHLVVMVGVEADLLHV